MYNFIKDSEGIIWGQIFPIFSLNRETLVYDILQKVAVYLWHVLYAAE